MKIHNIRMGLATNSSSTHSLIFMNDGVNLPTDEYSDFGWQYFTAANVESKENYLGIVLRHNLDVLVGEDTAAFILDALFTHRGNFSEELANGYVDHESMWSLPTNWDGKGVDLKFFEHLRRYILNRPVAILGGNDNDGFDHPKSSFGTPVNLGFVGGMVARNDGDHWVLFNRVSGAKIRVDFSEQVKTETVKKAATPELVDIKITDYCPFGCAFCYQGSTSEGKHADWKKSTWKKDEKGEYCYEKAYEISHLINLLAEMKVFEVAIGGGEPTLHPHFLDYLESFKYHHITPNFTTKNLAWLNDDHLRPRILEACGAFAYSVQTREDVSKLVDLLGKYKIERGKVSLQYVLDSGGDLYGILDEASRGWGLRVTLLGFKTTGFGENFPVVPEDWIATVSKIREEGKHLNLGVDTAVVQKYGDKIEKLGVKKEFMTAEEGKFSMYIDAVNHRIAPSSYCDESQYIPYDPRTVSTEEILENFGRW